MELTQHIFPIATAIYAEYEKREGAEKARTYLGASQIGKACERALWYSFRWVDRERFDGRMLRLFQTGHLAESRFVDDLRSIGVTVHDVDPHTGKQFGFQDHGGHMRGHMDGCAHNVPTGGAKWHVVEFKTHGDKSFKSLQKDAVTQAKPEHYAQMQWYMGKSGMTRALYLAVNKNTDELYAERVRFDPLEFAKIQAKAERIIFSDTPPPKLSDNPKFWQCNFCAYQDVCHHDKLPAATCRSCCHATPERHGDARWSCALQGDNNISSIPVDIQRTGCPSHLTSPHVITFAKPVDAGHDWVMYQAPAGQQFVVSSERASAVPLKEHVFISRELPGTSVQAILGT